MIIQVGDAIGVAPTLALLILDGFVGAALARSQGRAAWERFNRRARRGPGAGPRDLRRRDDHPRRRAAAGARVHHRRGRLRAADPADPGGRPAVVAGFARRRIAFGWAVPSSAAPRPRPVAPDRARSADRARGRPAATTTRAPRARSTTRPPSSSRASAVADAVAIEFTGARRRAAARFEWARGPARRARPGARRPSPVWRLGGELDWDEVDPLRVSRRGSTTAACWRSRRCARPAPTGTARSWSRACSVDPGELRAARRGAVLDRVRTPTALPRRVGLELYGAGGGLAAPDRRRRRGDRARRERRSATRLDGAGVAIRGEGGAGRPRRARAPMRRLPITRGDLRLRRRADDAADGLVRGLSGPDRDPGRGAGTRDAGDRRARRRPPPLRARDRADDRGRLPRADRGRRSSPSSATGPRCTGSSEIYFEALEPNEPMIELMREIKRTRPDRMALLTNNVREWEPLWRSMLPGRRDLRARRRLGLRRHAQARSADLRADDRAARRRDHRRASACSSTTSLVNVEAARELGMIARPLPRQRAGDRRDRGGARRWGGRPHAPERSGATVDRVKRDAAVEAVFQPVRPPTTFEETVERLGTAIRVGLLAPGSKLPPERAARRGAADLALDPAPGAHDPGPVGPPDLGPRPQRRHLRRRAPAAARARRGPARRRRVGGPRPPGRDRGRRGDPGRRARRGDRPRRPRRAGRADGRRRATSRCTGAPTSASTSALAEAARSPHLVTEMTEVQGQMSDLIALHRAPRGGADPLQRAASASWSRCCATATPRAPCR